MDFNSNVRRGLITAILKHPLLYTKAQVKELMLEVTGYKNGVPDDYDWIHNKNPYPKRKKRSKKDD